MLLKYNKRYKGIEEKEEFKGTQEYIVKYFAFYYNNIYQVYKEAKYSINYQPKELKLDIFRGIKKED